MSKVRTLPSTELATMCASVDSTHLLVLVFVLGFVLEVMFVGPRGQHARDAVPELLEGLNGQVGPGAAVPHPRRAVV